VNENDGTRRSRGTEVRILPSCKGSTAKPDADDFRAAG
jgi:hypothetical protein